MRGVLLLSDWFTIPAIIMIYLGFASLQGALIHWLRANISRDAIIAGISYSVLVFIPASLSLPLAPLLRLALWGAALLLILIFAVRPAGIPAWLLSMRFALRYGALTMSLILLWSLIDQPSVWGLILAAVAALAGGLAWQRSNVKQVKVL